MIYTFFKDWFYFSKYCFYFSPYWLIYNFIFFIEYFYSVYLLFLVLILCLRFLFYLEMHYLDFLLFLNIPIVHTQGEEIIPSSSLIVPHVEEPITAPIANNFSNNTFINQNSSSEKFYYINHVWGGGSNLVEGQPPRPIFSEIELPFLNLEKIPDTQVANLDLDLASSNSEFVETKMEISKPRNFPSLNELICFYDIQENDLELFSESYKNNTLNPDLINFYKASTSSQKEVGWLLQYYEANPHLVDQDFLQGLESCFKQELDEHKFKLMIKRLISRS